MITKLQHLVYCLSGNNYSQKEVKMIKNSPTETILNYIAVDILEATLKEPPSESLINKVEEILKHNYPIITNKNWPTLNQPTCNRFLIDS